MNPFNFNEIFKQAGEIKGQMEQIRERARKMRITGEAGAGMVRVEVNGEGLVQRIDIEPALLSPGEKTMLEELITGAINDAQNRAREAMSHEMGALTGNLNIPGAESLMKLFGLDRT